MKFSSSQARILCVFRVTDSILKQICFLLCSERFVFFLVSFALIYPFYWFNNDLYCCIWIRMWICGDRIAIKNSDQKAKPLKSIAKTMCVCVCTALKWRIARCARLHNSIQKSISISVLFCSISQCARDNCLAFGARYISQFIRFSKRERVIKTHIIKPILTNIKQHTYDFFFVICYCFVLKAATDRKKKFANVHVTHDLLIYFS